MQLDELQKEIRFHRLWPCAVSCCLGRSCSRRLSGAVDDRLGSVAKYYSLYWQSRHFYNRQQLMLQLPTLDRACQQLSFLAEQHRKF